MVYKGKSLGDRLQNGSRVFFTYVQVLYSYRMHVVINKHDLIKNFTTLLLQ